jgi:hypothetical protein
VGFGEGLFEKSPSPIKESRNLFLKKDGNGRIYPAYPRLNPFFAAAIQSLEGA